MDFKKYKVLCSARNSEEGKHLKDYYHVLAASSKCAAIEIIQSWFSSLNSMYKAISAEEVDG